MPVIRLTISRLLEASLWIVPRGKDHDFVTPVLQRDRSVDDKLFRAA